MITYRNFLNTDPPLIVEIWRQQEPFRHQLTSLTHGIFDRTVLSKVYFDRQGFFLAFDEENGRQKPLGFVHAAFAPNELLSDLDKSVGIVAQLKVVDGDKASEAAAGLLQRAEVYLRENGARRVHFGSRFPLSPFYHGLYGGSRIPGVMENDKLTYRYLTESDYEVDEKILVLDRSLAGYRALIDRQQMTLRRQYQIKAVSEPPEKSWWESCTFGLVERDLFAVSHKLHRNVCASVAFWDMQPLATEWGVNCRGMYDLSVTPELRQCGMATFLVGESLRHLMMQGVSRVQAQCQENREPALAVFRKLGFETVTRGILLSKTL